MELSLKEASEYLNISVRTLQRRIKQGDYLTRKEGKRMLVIVNKGINNGEFSDAIKEDRVNTDNSPQNDALMQVIKGLQEDLKAKDAQITSLHKLLENQQVLARELQSKVLMLDSPKSDKKSESVKEELKTKKKLKKVKKVSIFSKIFGRK